jgi:hypothetical protein
MFGSAVVKELLRFQMLKTTIEPMLENEASPQTDLWKKGAPQFLFNENNNITKKSKIFHIFTKIPIYIQIFLMPCASFANLRAVNPSVNLRAGESVTCLWKLHIISLIFSFDFYIILFF